MLIATCRATMEKARRRSVWATTQTCARQASFREVQQKVRPRFVATKQAADPTPRPPPLRQGVFLLGAC